MNNQKNKIRCGGYEYGIRKNKRNYSGRIKCGAK